MDSEFKKLLAGASWADTGDRIDMDDSSIQPTIDRSEGYSVDFSTDTTPTRARINQILRELSGAAKEVVRGVSAYDAEVDYPQGSICQANGDLYYAVVAHSAASPVNPLTLGQTAWATIAGRSAAERTVPAEVPSANIFIDGDRADRFQVWWYPPDNGGHQILQSQVRWAKDINFAGGTQTTGSPGFERTISTHDSDLFYVSVRSRNQLGWSPWSAAKQVRPAGPVVPGDIITLSVQPINVSGSLLLRWNQPDTRGLNITGYRVQWKTGNQDYVTTTDRSRVLTQTGATHTYTLSGLDSSLFYDVRVLAVSNRNTESASGTEQTARPVGRSSVPPNPSLSTEAVSATRSRAWISSIVGDGGAAITYHEWSWKLRSEADTEWRVENNNNSSFIIKHDRGQLIDVRLRLNNANGLSTGVIRQIPAFTPSRPESPTITVQSSTTAVADSLKGLVSFSMGNLSTPEVVKDRIIQTAVRWAPTGGSNWTELESASYPNLTDNNFSAKQTFPATGNLTLDQALDVQARWRNSGGWSDWTDSIELGAVTAPSGALVLSKTQTTVPEGGSSIINVSLSRQPIEDTTVTITSSNTDLTISPATLTFTESNWGTAQSITLSSIVDADDINDIAIVTLRTTGGLSVSDDTIAVTIQEPVRMIANWANGPIDIPEGGTASLIIGLTGEPSSNVNVTISKTGSDDITLNASSLTFTPANWKTQQVVTVSAATDADADNDSANITIQATGGVSATLTREVNVTDGVTRVELMVGPEQGASIGAGLSRTFTIQPASVPAAGFVLNILPVNPNHVSVSPSTMTFTRLDWDTAQTLTVSIPSNTPAGLNEWITLEPANAPDVQSHEIELITTNPLVEAYNRSAYIIPEGNRIPSPTEGTALGVSVNGAWPTGNDITITPSSENPDLSFSPATGTISASGANFSAFNISAGIDSDIVSENIPVVYTATGGISASLSVPTMVLEPTNTLRPVVGRRAIQGRPIGPVGSYINGTYTLYKHASGFNGVYAAHLGFRLLNEPPAGSTITISGGIFVSGKRVSDNSAREILWPTTIASSSYNTDNFPTLGNFPSGQQNWTAWSYQNELSSGTVVAVYDFIPSSDNASVSMPIFRITFVAP